jgi:hypothetical protein
MNTRFLHRLVRAGAVSLILAAAPALAIRPVTVITGTVTAPPSPSRVEVDNKIYRLSEDPNTAASLKGITTGMLVDVIMDGPANEPTSRVMAVTRHTTR